VGLLALVLLGTASGLSACGHGPSDAVTTLRGAADVTVTTAAGVTAAAVDGERLAVGDVVRTAGSRTALLTGGRITTLGADTAVLIAARSRYVLSDGTLVLDRRDGAPATVDAGPVTVDQIGHTAVRVEEGFAVRVAVYDGGTAQVSASQRSVTVPALHEVDVAGTSLPTAVPPLALRDDALDAVADPDLVAGDIALVSRSAVLDSPAGASLSARLADLVPTVLPAASVVAAQTSAPLSERVLPIAIARAAGGDVASRFAQADALRAAGGSWAVVAGLVGAGVTAVENQISVLAAAVPSAGLPPVAVAGTTPLGGGTIVAGGSGPTPVASPSAAGDAPARSSTPVAARPPASATPVPSVTTTVTGLLGTVLGLLAPSSSSAPRATATSTGLLGGLLDK
jgi:hypothetical protein